MKIVLSRRVDHITRTRAQIHRNGFAIYLLKGQKKISQKTFAELESFQRIENCPIIALYKALKKGCQRFINHINTNFLNFGTKSLF